MKDRSFLDSETGWSTGIAIIIWETYPLSLADVVFGRFSEWELR